MYSALRSIGQFTAFSNTVNRLTNGRTHNIEAETSEINRSTRRISFGKRNRACQQFFRASGWRRYFEVEANRLEESEGGRESELL